MTTQHTLLIKQKTKNILIVTSVNVHFKKKKTHTHASKCTLKKKRLTVKHIMLYMLKNSI